MERKAGKILFTGRMMACFHCVGTVDADREMSNTLAIDLANTGAPTLKNHAGSLSSPVAVCRSVEGLEHRHHHHHHHHHHHLFLKRLFLPRSARVRRLPRGLSTHP